MTGKNISYDRGGFTFVELMIAVAIIGILTTIVIASLQAARAKSRDARRLSEIKQLSVAADAYFQDKFEYPPDIDAFQSFFDNADYKTDPVGKSYEYERGNLNEKSFCIGTVVENIPVVDECGGDDGFPAEYNYKIKGGYGIFDERP